MNIGIEMLAHVHTETLIFLNVIVNLVVLLFLYVDKRNFRLSYANDLKRIAHLVSTKFQDAKRDCDRSAKRAVDESRGVVQAWRVKAKVSEKLSERAFSLASSANLAIMALQRTLQTRPQYATKKQQIQNEVAQQDVMETVGGTTDYSGFDWMYPILDDEERELIDNARALKEKYANGSKEQ